MRIYIIEDDITVISILEDIVEQNDLGTVCGDTADAPPDLEGILAADPDLILVDLLMPGKDGIQVVRELKEGGSRAKFIMISQVSAKEMVARAYSAGVDFFIQKPINLIEVRQVIQNVSRQIENEQALRAIQSVFAGRAPAPPPEPPLSRERRRIKHILSQLGWPGEKGSQDIIELCIALLQRGQTASQVGVAALCAQLSDNPKTMEQRARRALDRGLIPHRQPGGGGLYQRVHHPLLRPPVPLSGGPGRDGPPPGQGPRRQGQPAHLFRRTAGPD